VSDARRIMVIDCQTAGISGDMLLGALIDLGSNTAKISEAMRSIKDNLKGCNKLQMEASPVTRNGIRAIQAIVKVEEEVSERTGAELTEAALEICESLKLSQRARTLAVDAVTTLVEAETKVHGESSDKVHLHELGSADTLADVIGVAVALDDLNLFENSTIYATPVSVGSGRMSFSHGTVPVPAPATLEILRARSFPMLGQQVDSELATPTGVSILVNLAHKVTSSYPLMKPVSVGYGAGTKEFAEIANVLRITTGENTQRRLFTDEIYVLETNVDDVPGEVIGHTLDRILKEGARDFSIVPMFTKKNRPGQILKVIADEGKTEELAQILMEETGTLGVRVYPCQRYVLARESVIIDATIEGVKEQVSVRVARNNKGEIVQIKPEYEEARRLAMKTGRPLKELSNLIQREALDILTKGDEKSVSGGS